MEKYRLVDNVLYINLEGRVDANNATAVEKEILDIRQANPSDELVIDADKLEYISSAGLRVILRLRKQEKNMKLINVSSNVYEILEMTGFTDIVEVVKAFRRISIEGCEIIGKGANGTIYRYDPETIVKVFHNPDSLEEIKTERDLARKAFVLGINTAIPYDVVRVNDSYGTVFELLNATSLTKMIAKDNNNLDEPVKLFVDLLKKIHDVTVVKGDMPDMKGIAVDWCKYLENHLPSEDYAKLYNLISNAPESDQLLHGDYHTNNVMLQDGETILIDMDTLCMGHPIFEFASIFNAYVGFNEGNPERSFVFFGFDHITSYVFWRKTLSAYFNTTDEDKLNEIENKAKVVGYTRLLRRTLRREANTELGQKVISIFKEQLHDLLQVVTDLNL